ncbi:unnamed protein product [Gulo gulo]|uniref:Uncharacterized protein n=1 Tax=Gulo gulo TaxID=48420 RepID=A0A9X9LWF9_GULGU|nr:unnamed protein product [Gulo gulo]
MKFGKSPLLPGKGWDSVQACLLHIVGYKNLIVNVEKLCREPSDSDHLQHEDMLLKVSV